jgi:hypothetical protein
MTVMADNRWPDKVPFGELSHMRQAIDWYAQVAQSVEHVLGKDEVGGSIPLLGFRPD